MRSGTSLAACLHRSRRSLNFDSEIGTLSAKLDVLDAKVDALDAKFDARIDTLDAKFDARIDTLDAKNRRKDRRVGLPSSTPRIDALDAKFDARIDALDGKSQLENRLARHTDEVRFRNAWPCCWPWGSSRPSREILG